MRTVVITGGGDIAEHAIASLTHADVRPDAVVIRDSSPDPVFPVQRQSGPGSLVSRIDTPVISVVGADELVDACRRLSPELILSVCYPRRIPDALVTPSRVPILNLHTSSLPSWRGPDPVFWQLRAGATHIGLSLHVVTSTIDAGQVVARTNVNADDVQSESELNRMMGGCAGWLLQRWLHSADVEDASAAICARGLWWRSPHPDDYRIFPGWTREHAMRFMRILSSRGVAFLWIKDGKVQRLTGAAGPSSSGVVTLGLVDGSLDCVPVVRDDLH